MHQAIKNLHLCTLGRFTAAYATSLYTMCERAHAKKSILRLNYPAAIKIDIKFNLQRIQTKPFSIVVTFLIKHFSKKNRPRKRYGLCIPHAAAAKFCKPRHLSLITL